MKPSIAFVYAGGREQRAEAARAGEIATDFFYSAIELERAGYPVLLADLDPPSRGLAAGLLHSLARRSLPPKTSAHEILAALPLLGRLNAADAVVATASGCAFALAFWKRLGWLRRPLIGIHCGIVNFEHDAVRRASTARLLQQMTTVLFSANELDAMLRQFGPREIHPIWFGADHRFWTPADSPQPREKLVLAVGNDSRRDYQTLLTAAALLPDLSFQILTRLPAPDSLPANTVWRRGDWKGNGLSDAELREEYRSAACVAVPVVETIQPSGQSVAAQALLCCCPLVAVKNQGWWGAEVLREGQEVVLASPQDAPAMARAIRSAVEQRRNDRGRRALIEAGWTAEGFAERLGGLIERIPAK